MVESRTSGHAVPGQRTFDCPWCGAIARIPADHMGEHFSCPECKKSTKVTDKNTSTLHLTAPPPDAPHLSGDRTFDCPWCGAISSIPSSHLGEHYACPECRKQTKLTEKNTTRRPASEPPPDAPHVETPAGGRGVLVALALVLVGAGAWFFLAGRKTETEPKQPTATRSRTPSPPPAPAPSVPGPREASPAPAPTAPLIESEALKAARSRVAAAQGTVAAAETALAEVRSRLAPYAGADAEAARANLTALRQIAAESAAIRDKMGADATPDDVRAYNLTLVLFVDAAPARVRVVEAALEWLRKDAYGRDVMGLGWREMNFHGFGFPRALQALETDWSSSGKPVPPALREEERQATSAVDAAKRALADAEAALATTK